VLIAAIMLGLSAAGFLREHVAAILGSVNIALIIVLFAILDRGRNHQVRRMEDASKEVERCARLIGGHARRPGAGDNGIR